jgi:hypothetical protein
MSRGWKVLFGAALAGSLLLDLLRPRDEAVYLWDHLFFFAAMGLLGTAVLTVLAKVVLSKVADRDEDYYEPYEVTETEATGQGTKEVGYDW